MTGFTLRACGTGQLAQQWSPICSQRPGKGNEWAMHTYRKSRIPPTSHTCGTSSPEGMPQIHTNIHFYINWAESYVKCANDDPLPIDHSATLPLYLIYIVKYTSQSLSNNPFSLFACIKGSFCSEVLLYQMSLSQFLGCSWQ